jgi:hypothetical protein
LDRTKRTIRSIENPSGSGFVDARRLVDAFGRPAELKPDASPRLERRECRDWRVCETEP